MKYPSIYRTLQISLSALFVISLLLAAYFTFHIAGEQIDKDYDGQLIADSYMVWTLVKEELGEEKNLDEVKELLEMHSLSDEQRQELAQFNQFRAFRVWKGSNLVLRSDTAPPDSIAATPVGFTDQKLSEAVWRVYTMHLAEENISVEAWENHEIRDRLLHKILRGVAESALFVIPLLWVVLLGVIQLGLRGFHRMRQQIESRDLESLELLHVKKLPQELKPLEDAINSLITKLRHNLERERLLIDTTAHEIRTPLTTLKLQGQLIKAARSEDERKQAIADLLSSLDRTVQLANQLLVFSKVKQQKIHFAPIKLYSLTQELLSDFALLAAEKSLEVSLDGDENMSVVSNAELLKILLSIFIDNAIKYSPSGKHIKLHVIPTGITIEDSGPGVPDHEKEKIFDKFYRGQSLAKGTGLGLAIAKEIVERLDCSVRVYDGYNTIGLKVDITWPENAPSNARL